MTNAFHMAVKIKSPIPSQKADRLRKAAASLSKIQKRLAAEKAEAPESEASMEAEANDKAPAKRATALKGYAKRP